MGSKPNERRKIVEKENTNQLGPQHPFVSVRKFTEMEGYKLIFRHRYHHCRHFLFLLITCSTHQYEFPSLPEAQMVTQELIFFFPKNSILTSCMEESSP